MHKYQFCISFNDKPNTAASKAIQDCKSIFAELGYQDYSVEEVLASDKNYIFRLLICITKFFLTIKSRSIVAVQYPLLSGNSMFKYFIKAARLKKVKFFCVIHDLDELRNNTSARTENSEEAEVLNHYDCVISHNASMKTWLRQRKVIRPIVNLEIFDYLTIKSQRSSFKVRSSQDIKNIVFAGNLSKSSFIYSLNHIDEWHFNVYGPNFLTERGQYAKNLLWKGAVSPDEIVVKMDGAFGLIWDGEFIDRLDDKFGNYLKYNNPHKLSLYLAAGLPVIAPDNSASGAFIKEHNIGILVDNLLQLNEIQVNVSQYEELKNNVLLIADKIKNGEYLENAVFEVENFLSEAS